MSLELSMRFTRNWGPASTSIAIKKGYRFSLRNKISNLRKN